MTGQAPTLDEYVLDPRFVAGVDMLRRTGAADVQIRWSDDEDPTVWFVVVRHRVAHGRPQPFGPINAWETAAGHDPVEAVLRLCEQVIDGGTCAHCDRPTMFVATLDEDPDFPLQQGFCVTSWDPELATYRRICEGDTP